MSHIKEAHCKIYHPLLHSCFFRFTGLRPGDNRNAIFDLAHQMDPGESRKRRSLAIQGPVSKLQTKIDCFTVENASLPRWLFRLKFPSPKRESIIIKCDICDKSGAGRSAFSSRWVLSLLKFLVVINIFKFKKKL